MQGIIVLSDNKPREKIESKLVKVCFTAIFGSIEKFFKYEDTIISQSVGNILEEDGRKNSEYLHLGSYNAQYQSTPLLDGKGHRTAYVIETIDEASLPFIDVHVKKYHGEIIEMYQWSDTADFKIGKMSPLR